MATSGQAFSESQALTRAAPTLVTEGQDLKTLVAVTVIVEAPAGQTLSGAGTLKCYVWDDFVAGWTRVPGNDLTVTLSGDRRMGFPVFWVPGPRSSRLLFAASGVTVSSGTAVAVYQLGYSDSLKGTY